MIQLKAIFLICCVIVLQSCNNTAVVKKQYKDGIYCAKITFTNKSTNTRSTEQLNIEVKQSKVTAILFNNTSLPDDGSFNPMEIYGNGHCSLNTENGNTYDVEITGTECIFINHPEVITPKENESQTPHAENNKCPSCGGIMLNIWNGCPNCAQIAKTNKKQKRHNKVGAICPECGEYDEEMEEGDDMCTECIKKQQLKNQSKEKSDDEEDDN